MNRFGIYTIRYVLACIALVMIAGCNGKSFEYVNENEIPPGPGVFTGEKGEWTIYNSDAKKEPGQKSAAAESDDPAKNTTAAGGSAAVTAAEDPETREFKQFQEWKKEQQDFRAFQEWKKSKQGAREYREFLEWQQWKAYKQWQESQNKTE